VVNGMARPTTAVWCACGADGSGKSRYVQTHAARPVRPKPSQPFAGVTEAMPQCRGELAGRVSKCGVQRAAQRQVAVGNKRVGGVSGGWRSSSQTNGGTPV